MKYNLFIGKWSPFHNGHKTIIDSFLNNGKPVCIAIRDSEEKYPVSLRMAMIKSVYLEEFRTGKLKIITIPDITEVVIGRTVGYSLVRVPDEILEISGTKIRGGLSQDVPEEVAQVIKEWEEYKDYDNNTRYKRNNS